ncbi:uncharacterized protein [Mytilus edulis]|uniref:uncharacterized protein n=1 Tax=Mytilus edulis TaxID=6550 RepID=UPI0039EFCD66
MASSNPIPCGPCQEIKRKTKADIWCYNCDEGLCLKCSGLHKKSKGKRHHKTINIKNYKPSIHPTECGKHQLQLKLYCPDHLMPCCDKCISTSHLRCTGIESLTSVVEKTKFEKSKKSVEKVITNVLHFIDEMVTNKSKNIQTGKQECEGIKQSILKIREKINKHLDQLETNLCLEIDTIWVQQKTKALDFITEFERQKKELKTMSENLDTVIAHDSNLQSFLGVHKIEQRVHECQRYVEDLDKDDKSKDFMIKMKQNGEIEKLLSNLESVKSLGEIIVEKTEVPITRETTVSKDAQVHSREKCNIHNMTMNIEAEEELGFGTNVSDMICLMDGRVLIIGIFSSNYILTSDRKHFKELPISESSFAVTQINQDTIAITCADEKAIKIFNMEIEKVTKVITLITFGYGISFSNNSLAVALDNNEIHIIDLEGNTIKSIKVQSEIFHLVYCNDRVVYSDSQDKAVYCFNVSGKQIWQYKQDLLGPHGLCTDSYGNVIVADYESNRIIVISRDGQDSKVLFKSDERLTFPQQHICFKHNESSGFVCDAGARYSTKFNLSYE